MEVIAKRFCHILVNSLYYELPVEEIDREEGLIVDVLRVLVFTVQYLFE